MSENIGKHLLSTSYAYPVYQGEIVGETARFWSVQKAPYRQRRIGKNSTDIVLPATADIEASIAAYDATYRSFREHIAEVAEALRSLQDERIKASIAAARGESQ